MVRLVDNRLLRADPRVGSVYYELSHDTLVKPIRNSQKRREQGKIERSREISKLYEEAGQLAIERKFKEAIVKYNRIIERDKTFVKAYLGLGQLFAEQGRLDDAVDTYKKVVQTGIRHAKIYSDWGRVLTSTKRSNWPLILPIRTMG